MPQSIGLRQRLPVELVDPLRGTVGRNDHQRHMLIPGLCHGGGEIEQGSAGGDTYDYRLIELQRHAQGIEACRALVGDGITGDVGTFVQVVDNGRVATARADDGMTDAIRYEQHRQYVYFFLIAVHLRIDDLRIDDSTTPHAWFRAWPLSPATLALRCCP